MPEPSVPDPQRGILRRVAEAFEEWDGYTSMTRVIAWIFAIVLSISLLVLAFRDHLHEVGWPVAAMVVACIFAVPLQALFKALAEWSKSHAGKKLLDKLISKVSGSDSLTISSDSPTISTQTTVTPAGEVG